MNEDQEEVYERGERAAWRELLSLCIRNLGYEGKNEVDWITEREAAIAQLRMLCDDYGDNDWDDTLHLADVIEKHIGRYLDEIDSDDLDESDSN